MRRPKSQDRPDEIAYADVAMAVLGPIMVLMIVFAVQAGNLRANQGCIGLDPEDPDEQAEFRLKVSQTEQTLRQLRAENGELRQTLEARQCRVQLPDTPDLSWIEASGRVATLSNACQPTRSAIIDAVPDASRDEIVDLFTENDALKDALQSCAASDGAAACRRPEPAQRSSLIAALQRWNEQTEAQIADLGAILEDGACKGADGEPADWTTVPRPLSGICYDASDGIAAEAGLDLDTLSRKAGELSWYRAQAAQCLGGGDDCRDPLPPDEREAYAADLVAWHERLVARTDELATKADALNCPDLLDGQPDPVIPELAGVSPVLRQTADMCHSHRTAITEAAGLDAEQLQRTMRRYVDAMSRIERCLRESASFSTRRRPEIEFGSCALDMEFASTGKDEATYFADMAKEVERILQENEHINRIDIIGRTDLVPPGPTCERRLQPGLIRNSRMIVPDHVGPGWDPQGPDAEQSRSAAYNMLLSTYRSMVYREKLFDALQQAGLGQLLRKRNVRIYAIGAGIDKPAFADVEPGEDRLQLRRIDIRFVHDRFANTQDQTVGGGGPVGPGSDDAN
jgi:hypothetical protein